MAGRGLVFVVALLGDAANILSADNICPASKSVYMDRCLLNYGWTAPYARLIFQQERLHYRDYLEHWQQQDSVSSDYLLSLLCAYVVDLFQVCRRLEQVRKPEQLAECELLTVPSRGSSSICAGLIRPVLYVACLLLEPPDRCM